MNQYLFQQVMRIRPAENICVIFNCCQNDKPKKEPEEEAAGIKATSYQSSAQDRKHHSDEVGPVLAETSDLGEAVLLTLIICYLLINFCSASCSDQRK